MLCWQTTYDRLKERIEGYGIRVEAKQLGFETTGIFDGHSITTNTDYDWETRCHNLAHSFGHVAQWSLDHDKFRALYDQLYAAKACKNEDCKPLEAALARFREYEEEASDFAVWLYEVAECKEALPAFTNFARADIEAIVGFHRDGSAPVWSQFFTDWNTSVRTGKTQLAPFTARPVPSFKPIYLEPQEVIQEVDGK